MDKLFEDLKRPVNEAYFERVKTSQNTFLDKNFIEKTNRPQSNSVSQNPLANVSYFFLHGKDTEPLTHSFSSLRYNFFPVSGKKYNPENSDYFV